MGKDPKVQKEADELIQKFIEGNTNPGLGSKTCLVILITYVVRMGQGFSIVLTKGKWRY